MAAKNKVVLLTGARGSLGLVIAKTLIRNGFTVYALTRGAAVFSHPNLHWLATDINDVKDCKNAVGAIAQKEGLLDVIINNAGMTLSGPTLEFSEEDFKKIIEINTIAPFRLTKAAYELGIIPKLVINITSLNGFMSYPNFGIYSASKHALEALGFALRRELAPLTRVVNIAPGGLESENKNDAPHKTIRQRIPPLNWLMPLTKKEDVANIIVRTINARSSPPRILIGADAYIVNLMFKIMPYALIDKLIEKIWRK